MLFFEQFFPSRKFSHCRIFASFELTHTSSGRILHSRRLGWSWTFLGYSWSWLGSILVWILLGLVFLLRINFRGFSDAIANDSNAFINASFNIFIVGSETASLNLANYRTVLTLYTVFYFTSRLLVIIFCFYLIDSIFFFLYLISESHFLIRCTYIRVLVTQSFGGHNSFIFFDDGRFVYLLETVQSLSLLWSRTHLSIGGWVLVHYIESFEVSCVFQGILLCQWVISWRFPGLGNGIILFLMRRSVFCTCLIFYFHVSNYLLRLANLEGAHIIILFMHTMIMHIFLCIISIIILLKRWTRCQQSRICLFFTS